jgi:ATP:corrinoid adenosyltransferase
LMLSTNDSWRGTYARRIEVSAATSLLDEVLIALNPDALDVKEVPEGIVKRNKYAQFKPYKELTNG